MSHFQPRDRQQPTRFVRPRLEVLEGRLVLDALSFMPQNGSTAWNVQANWFDSTQGGQGFKLPGSTDNVTIPSGTTCPLGIDASVHSVTVAGTLTIAGIVSGNPVQLSAGSASIGGGKGGTLNIGSTGGTSPGDMDVTGTMTTDATAQLTLTGHGSVDSALDVAVITAAGTTTDTTTGIINISSSGSFTGATAIDGRLDAPNGALGGTGTIGIGGTVDGGTIIFANGSTWTVVANGTPQGNLGGGQFFVDGSLSITSGLLHPQGDLTLDSDGGINSSGSITGRGSLDLWNKFTWDGGIIGVSGGTTIEASAEFTTAGSHTKTMTTGTILNDSLGTDLGGTGTLGIDSTAIFDIAYGTVKVSLPLISGPAGALGLFENIGGATLEFDAPASTPTTVLCNFTNSAYLKVDAGDAALISNAPVVGPPRTMNLDGNLALQGDLTLYGTIAAPTGLTMSAGGGTLKGGGGTTGTTGTLSLPQGMSIDGSANMEVTDYSFVTGAGQLYNAGTLTLDIGRSTSGLGSYQETSTGTLDLKAASATSYSKLTVSGTATLSGTLKLDFENGFTPTKGTSFRVGSAGSIGAHFDTTPAGMTTTYDSTGGTCTQN